MAKFVRERYMIEDIEAEIIVERTTRKEILSWMDEFIENSEYGYWDDDDTFAILYEYGTEDYIAASCYEGHKIRRQHIVSLVYSNAESYMVFGPIEMNEYGCVTTSAEENISSYNIRKIA